MAAYIADHSIDCEHLVFENSCHSVAEAAETAGVSVDLLVKNICMIDQDGKLIVAIVPGMQRASTTRVGKALSTERPRTATPEEILATTGYPCGGTPSFGFEAIFLVDSQILEQDTIYT